MDSSSGKQPSQPPQPSTDQGLPGADARHSKTEAEHRRRVDESKLEAEHQGHDCGRRTEQTDCDQRVPGGDVLTAGIALGLRVQAALAAASSTVSPLASIFARAMA
jgi:hypothetical protein